jgi:hypothetical protein
MEEDAAEQHPDAGDGEQDPADERAVVDTGAHPTDGRDEVRVTVVEASLHLVEKSLLLLGKWHPDPSSPEWCFGYSTVGWGECTHGAHG